MINEVKIRKTYFPCNECRKKGNYHLMYWQGTHFECKNHHGENIEEHLKKCSFENLCYIIKELLQERESSE